MLTKLKGVLYELLLIGTPTKGETNRTVGMNDDEYSSYEYKFWSGTGKLTDLQSGKEIVFNFKTDARKDYYAGIAFKKENYGHKEWDVSLEEFVFATHFASAEASKEVSVCDKGAWVDLIAEKIIESQKASKDIILEFRFTSTPIPLLQEKGIIAEFSTKQIQMALR